MVMVMVMVTGVLCCPPQNTKHAGITPADCGRNTSNRPPQDSEIPKEAES